MSPEFPKGLKEIYELLFVVAIIGLTSMAGVIHRQRKEERWVLKTFVIDLFCSTSTGFIAYFLLMGFFHNEYIAIGGASYCGHLGPIGIDFITNWIKTFWRLGR